MHGGSRAELGVGAETPGCPTPRSQGHSVPVRGSAVWDTEMINPRSQRGLCLFSGKQWVVLLAGDIHRRELWSRG